MEQLERLNDEDLTDEELQAEIKRSRAMADIMLNRRFNTPHNRKLY